MDEGRGERRYDRPRAARRAPIWTRFAVVVLATALLGIGASLILSPPPPAARLVTDLPMTVLLTAADIPDVGWGVRASGADGTAAWRVFAAHSEVVIATFNVTLWVEPNATAAKARMDGLVAEATYGPQDGGVAGADASRFWISSLGRDAGIVVLRYNVAFLLVATSETPMSLTRSDLGVWSGWQLQRIESLAN